MPVHMRVCAQKLAGRLIRGKRGNNRRYGKSERQNRYWCDMTKKALLDSVLLLEEENDSRK